MKDMNTYHNSRQPPVQFLLYCSLPDQTCPSRYQRLIS